METPIHAFRHAALTLGLPGLLLWCLGVPAALCATLFSKRKHLDESQVVAHLGFLFVGYKHRLSFWEVMIMLRKFLVVAAVSLVSSRQHRFIRLILCLGVVFVSLILQVR